MNLFEEFKQTVQTEEFKEWQKKEHNEAEERLNCDITTKEGRINHLLDMLDDLGIVVHTNAKRDEQGKLMYDEHGKLILLDGETEALIEDRSGLLSRLSEETGK